MQVDRKLLFCMAHTLSKECLWVTGNHLIYVCGQTCTCVHKWKSVSGLWRFTAGSWKACLERSLPTRQAFLKLGSANRLEERVDRSGPLQPQCQVCHSPVPWTRDLYGFLITTVPMATRLCWLCFQHKRLRAVCSVSPSVDQIDPVPHFTLWMLFHKLYVSPYLDAAIELTSALVSKHWAVLVLWKRCDSKLKNNWMTLLRWCIKQANHFFLLNEMLTSFTWSVKIPVLSWTSNSLCFVDELFTINVDI